MNPSIDGSETGMIPTTRLVAKDVSFSYHGNDILTDVSLSLRGGNVVGVVGPNGVGKTTLFSLLVGDLSPRSGSVAVNGVPVAEMTDRSGIFGVSLPSYGFSSALSVRSALSDVCSALGAQRDTLARLKRRFGVDSFEHKRIGKLSTGMRKKFELVVAAMKEPPIMLLDEPTNGLDVESVAQLRCFVGECRQRGCLILVSSHSMSELDSVADSLIGVHDGSVAMLETFQPGVPGSAERSYQTMSTAEGGRRDAEK
ncbi:ATP-binding cassette domain-containing protein [Pseudoscardovia suis]|uniref:ABC transporter ATP-binding protein n=1 Tax=Pseudoscardovia suis TaxID=987063 RepID=A0A261F4G7_9BIFI|nr:ATP-binding cassette domain-containing protein [Pseudoscardovia suis]OZG53994.1 ABC transporter ATP-binding protein [Pseudoscardovia suis]PJJ65767.1 ABC-2 type transport system ATP-binding protein [Pseudoscardovia suis]